MKQNLSIEDSVCELSQIGQVVNITVTLSNATLLVGQDLTIYCTTDLSSEVSLRINRLAEVYGQFDNQQ